MKRIERGVARVLGDPRLQKVAIGAAVACAVPWLLLVGLAIATPLPDELRDPSRFNPSVRVLDRNGALLRDVRADDGSRARWARLDELGERAEKAILAAEDRRFYSHPGVDPLAMVRALGQAIWHRRIVSGASTLTQQLARTVVHRPRTFAGKVREMALALRIEWSLSKREILEQYLNRAPFGPGLRGIEAASRSYFDKPVRDLSLAEVSLLAGMPRGPSLYDPAKGTARIERRRNRIIGRLLSNGRIDGDSADRAVREPIRLAASPGSAGAPHFVRSLLRGSLDPRVDASVPPSEIVSTIDASLEREVEALARRTVRSLSSRRVTAASVVVLDNATGEILAYVGSPDFGDASRLGENDGVLAKRQPGSALKPFVYELAFETLGFTAATLLPDVDLHLGADGADYHPQNYDGRYHGPVRVREALANSYNVPAVYTASLLGTARLLERLREVGFGSLDHDASHYGPALALGDGEVRLIDLANAYATLARGGVLLPVRAVRSVVRMTPADVEPPVEPKAVMDRRETRLVTDILADPHARIASFGSEGPLELPFPVAAKTGTSKGFRDNWTVGYTDAVTVAVWVGNFDGSPMLAVSGIMGAAPLFRDVMLAAHRSRPPELAAQPPGFEEVEICPLSGALPSASCPHRRRELFASGKAPREACDMHTKVRIDIRNGLLAGAACPRNYVEERTYEAFDATFASWAKSAARPLSPDAYSPLCAARAGERVSLRPMSAGEVRPPTRPSADSNRARLTFPFDGAKFVYDEGASSRQSVVFRADAPKAATTVRLFLDGRLIESKRAPFLFEWPLARGTHLARAEPDVGEPSEPVEFTVR